MISFLPFLSMEVILLFSHQLCPTICDPMDCGMAGFLVPHYLSSCSNSWPLSQWCHPTFSTSVAPVSSCPQSFLASGSLPKSWLFALGGQSTGASASASVLPINIQELFPLGLTGLISWLSKGLSRIFSSSTVQKHHNSLVLSLPYGPELPHPYMTTGKTIALTRWTFVSKLMSLLLNMLNWWAPQIRIRRPAGLFWALPKVAPILVPIGCASAMGASRLFAISRYFC